MPVFSVETIVASARNAFAWGLKPPAVATSPPPRPATASHGSWACASGAGWTPSWTLWAIFCSSARLASAPSEYGAPNRAKYDRTEISHVISWPARP